MSDNFKKSLVIIFIVTILVSGIIGGAAGFWAATFYSSGNNLSGWMKQMLSGGNILSGNYSKVQTGDQGDEPTVKTDYETAVVNAVQKASPAVVSIIVTKDLPVIEQYYSDSLGNSDFFRQFFGDNSGDFFRIPQYRQNGTQKQEIGGGTGFIVTADGYILTNKHVVSDETAEYTVLLNDGTKPVAKVLARDPINDIAVLKIDGKNLPLAEFGNSSNLKVGQTVIAIGNALGEFRNTVSTGVISGLSRSVTAAGAGIGSEQLTGVIQTDASINLGNSGGPLVNLSGQVIGMNTAMAQGAENIGFAIPINEINNVFTSVKQTGKITRAWLGVRYLQINKTIADQNKLSVDYGALIVRGQNQTDFAIIPGSPADKAGLVENDIILEVNGKKISDGNSLAGMIGHYKPGDQVTLKVLSKGKEKTVKVTLEKMK